MPNWQTVLLQLNCWYLKKPDFSWSPFALFRASLAKPWSFNKSYVKDKIWLVLLIIWWSNCFCVVYALLWASSLFKKFIKCAYTKLDLILRVRHIYCLCGMTANCNLSFAWEWHQRIPNFNLYVYECTQTICQDRI